MPISSADQVADGSRPLPPGSTIGILGGGQLGRMLAMAAARLGLRCHIFCPDPASPAFEIAAHATVAAYDDFTALDDFARRVDVITYEFENVEVAAAERLAATRPVRPGPAVLAVAQDRVAEKNFLQTLGVETVAFRPVGNLSDLEDAVAALGYPAILKTRRFGYDGKGQIVIRSEDSLEGAWSAIGHCAAILEAFAPFAREISTIAVRGQRGEVAVYDPAENEHRNGILRVSRVPAPVTSTTCESAGRIARLILEALDYVGVLGIEFFVMGKGVGERLLVNEIAPRVHNTGHWTEDACLVSQFENHVRAVAGWPLGSTSRHADATMTNLIGADLDEWLRLASDPFARLHLYGKAEARPGRKMGHVNRLARQP